MIKTWCVRYREQDIGSTEARDEEIDELRAALAERDAEIQRQYACISSHAKITQAAEGKVEAQRKVLEQALEALKLCSETISIEQIYERGKAITAIQGVLKS